MQRDPEMRTQTTAQFVETYTFPFIVSAWLFLTTVLVVVWGVYGYLAALVVCVVLHAAMVPLDRRAAAIREADAAWRPGRSVEDENR
jgi:hypothetical protein